MKYKKIADFLRNFISTSTYPTRLFIICNILNNNFPNTKKNLKRFFLNRHSTDPRTIYIWEIGQIILSSSNKLPLLLGKFDHNSDAIALLEWRLENQI